MNGAITGLTSWFDRSRPRPKTRQVPSNNQENILHVYEDALSSIVVSPTIMGTSKIQEAIRAIEEKVTSLPPHEAIHTLAQSALVIALGEHSWNRRVEIPELEFQSNNLHHDIMRLHNDEMPSERERSLLRRCFVILIENRDERLRSLCGLLGRGYRECPARRRMALTTMILAAYDIIEKTTQSQSSQNTQNVATTTNPDDCGEDLLTKRKERIRSYCATYIDDIKENAFRSVFLEPCELFFDSVPEPVASGDVDVHGSNTFVALLEAMTPIRLPRFALLEDTFAGIMDISEVNSPEFQYAVTIIRQPCHVGKRYRSILPQSVRSSLRTRNAYHGHRRFIFNKASQTHSCHTVADLVHIASTPHLSTLSDHVRFATYYLAPFAVYFSAPEILPRLFNHCLQDTSGISEDLQQVFLSLKHSELVEANMLIIPEDVEHYCEWLWDIEQDPPVFQVTHAQYLFAACNVVQYPHNVGIGNVNSSNLDVLDVEEEGDHPGSSGQDDNAHAANTGAVFFDYEPTHHPSPSILGARIASHMITLTAAGDVRGGGTGQEYLPNLHLHGYTPGEKWLDPAYAQGKRHSSWIQMQFVASVSVTAYALCSANDCPERDPVHWRVWVQCAWDAGGDSNWTQVHEVNLQPNTNSTTGNSRIMARLRKAEGEGGEEDFFDPETPSQGYPSWRRHQWIAYPLPQLAASGMPISALKIEIVRFRGGNATKDVQLAHLHVFGHLI